MCHVHLSLCYHGAGMGSQSRRLGLDTVSRHTKVSSRSWIDASRLSLGAVCLGLGPVGLVSGLGHCISSRRFVQARAVHTVAAVRVMLTSMTFICGLDICLECFYFFIYLFIVSLKQSYVMSVFFRHKMTYLQ